jgi:hypothetical protein
MVGITYLLKFVLLAAAHPLHTSFAEVTFDTRAKTVDVSLRVFVDDYTSAAQSWARGNPARLSAPLVAYAVASLALRESNGRAVALVTCGEKRVGDLMWLCLRGQITRAPSGATVISRILFERFDDQVNIVQASHDGRKANLLFTSDDREKRIP